MMCLLQDRGEESVSSCLSSSLPLPGQQGICWYSGQKLLKGMMPLVPQRAWLCVCLWVRDFKRGTGITGEKGQEEENRRMGTRTLLTVFWIHPPVFATIHFPRVRIYSTNFEGHRWVMLADMSAPATASNLGFNLTVPSIPREMWQNNWELVFATEKVGNRRWLVH